MRLVKRKWGWYLTLLDREHFKVKLLWFREGGEISEQKHEYRDESWLFIKGYGILRHKLIDNHSVAEGSRFKIKRNEWHHFKAKVRTLVLEIQYGEKCIEEDIIRV